MVHTCNAALKDKAMTEISEVQDLLWPQNNLEPEWDATVPISKQEQDIN